MDSLKLPKLQTCLSPYVHKLIIEDTFSEERDHCVLDHNGLLDFEYICSKLPDEGSDDDLVRYFQTCVVQLAPMLHSVEDFLVDEKISLTEKYCQLLEWTGQTDALLELWEMMKYKDSINDLTVLLVTTSILERSLGNVYLINGPEPCPSMLKDLLVSEYLKTILGSHVLQVLRVIIGPPTSLNIRNITWHGFPAPAEIPTRCVWFIILLVPSIGQILRSKHISGIKLREPVSFTETSLISETQLFTHEKWPEVAEQSNLVFWNSQNFWEKVKQFYVNKRYSYCAAILLFYLEQGLRQVFATVNKCEDRILTAEATTLYTTFDEILDHSLPDGSQNKLCQFLSPQFVEILLDHLQYQNGPRIRDKLSHGEVCWKMFPWQLTHNLATIAVALSAKFIPDMSVYEELSGDVSKLFIEISEYKVQFHRIAVLQKNIKKCCIQATKIDGLILYYPDLSERGLGTEYPLSSLQLQLGNDIHKCAGVLYEKWTNYGVIHSLPDCLSYTACSRFSSLIDGLLSHHINTLYRDQHCQVADRQGTDREGEVLSVLEHIIAECNTVLNNLQDFISLRQQQMVDKQLRSRQRENLKKFLTSFPAYMVVCNMCSYLCCWQLYHLDTIKNPDGYTSKIRFWKKCLQFTENLRTSSQPDKNKWTDGLTLISEYISTLQSNILSQLMCVHMD